MTTEQLAVATDLESLEIGFMNTFNYCAVHGTINVIGKEPDGDSVRFKPLDVKDFSEISNSFKLRPNKEGTIQLRFENIDAPETHYGHDAQPLGAESRDKLLELIGFKSFKKDKTNLNKIVETKPVEIAATVLTKAADSYGRPISYVLIGHKYQSGEWTTIDSKTLRTSLNYKMVELGFAYPLFYNSNPKTHRKLFRAAAIAARTKDLGVWKTDESELFVLETIDSVKVGGQLIFPKLFRRCVDFFKAKAAGFDKGLKDWLLVTPDENDPIIVNENLDLKLSDILEQQNRRIRVKVDVLDIVVVPK